MFNINMCIHEDQMFLMKKLTCTNMRVFLPFKKTSKTLYVHLDLFITQIIITILDITLIIVGPKLVILDYFCYVYTFYCHYSTDWIANTEIGLNPNKSVIKWLRCNTQLRHSYGFSKKDGFAFCKEEYNSQGADRMSPAIHFHRLTSLFYLSFSKI